MLQIMKDAREAVDNWLEALEAFANMEITPGLLLVETDVVFEAPVIGLFAVLEERKEG